MSYKLFVDGCKVNKLLITYIQFVVERLKKKNYLCSPFFVDTLIESSANNL